MKVFMFVCLLPIYSLAADSSMIMRSDLDVARISREIKIKKPMAVPPSVNVPKRLDLPKEQPFVENLIKSRISLPSK